jgi:arylsulfatase A-like enzyme
MIATPAVLSLALATATAPPPVNLILITIDTLRADALGCYGRAGAVSPNLDRLSRSALRWTDGNSPVPLTLPAHASVMTGLYPTRHGLRGNARGALADSVPTLAGVLRAAGYRTAAVVGSFLLSRRFGLARDFDLYDDRWGGTASTAATGHPERDAGQVIDRALELLARLEPPFGLWVHLYDPHDPYRPPARFRARFDQPYLGEIAFADAELGRLFAELTRRRLWGRTLVIVTSDHGEDLDDHGEGTHGLFLYQSTLRVPLLLRFPDRRGAGTAPAAPASLVDLLPTICAALGLTAPPGLDGRDLLAAGSAAGSAAGRPLYAETLFPRLEFGWSELRALRQGRWKLIEAPQVELYDLEADPVEREDRAADQQVVVAEMRDALSRAIGPDRAESAAIAPEHLAALGALGYAGPASLGSSGPGRVDPKDGLALRRELLGLDQLDPPARSRRLAELRRSDPTNPTLALLAAQALAEGGERERAIELLQADTLAWSGAAELARWYWLARYRLEAGREQAAEAAFRECLRLEPLHVESLRYLVGFLLNRGAAAEALERARALVELDPEAGASRALLAASLRAVGELAAARAQAERGVRLDPAEGQAQRQLGLILLDLSQPRAAVAALQIAAELMPADAMVHYELASALDRSGEPQRAAQAAREFLRLARGRFPELERAARGLADHQP